MRITLPAAVRPAQTPTTSAHLRRHAPAAIRARGLHWCLTHGLVTLGSGRVVTSPDVWQAASNLALVLLVLGLGIVPAVRFILTTPHDDGGDS